ncbi:MAG: starch synthase [Planctomycetota bacterium]|jgi:starch synthase
MANTDIDNTSVLFVTPELAPFSKVGGLGEVSAGLTKALMALDVDVRIITPLHRSMRESLGPLKTVAQSVPMTFGGENRPFNLLALDTDPKDVPVFLIENPDFFENEDSIYGTEPGPTGLGDLKWLYFSAAIHPASQRLNFKPDLVHVHDWHSALVPALYRSEYFFDEDCADTACVLTIHNAAFQGRMSVEDYRRSGLRTDLLSDWYMLQGSEINLLKAGTIFAERVTTVSKRYATELRSRDQGKGLEAVFEARGEHFHGIPNGLDPEEWNPATDKFIPHHFTIDDMDGKKANKKALLEAFELEASDGPLLGVIARLTWQKGIDIILDSLPVLFARRRDLRLVILGQGDEDVENAVQEAAKKYPGRVGAALRFDPALAHLLEAGSDIFLMPSRYEPCGLNQMISQRYGTIPIVRETGGLADTVVPYEAGNINEATGFVFTAASSKAFIEITKRALTLYRRGGTWKRLVQNAMQQDWGWDEGAKEYLRVYEEAISMRRAREREPELLSHMRLEPTATLPDDQAIIPVFYKKDTLRLLIKDPENIWVYWEVQGPRGSAILDSLSEQQKWESTWTLVIENLDQHTSWELEVEGMAKNWFVSVDPNQRYRCDLFMQTTDFPKTKILSSNTVRTPKLMVPHE